MDLLLGIVAWSFGLAGVVVLWAFIFMVVYFMIDLYRDMRKE